MFKCSFYYNFCSECMYVFMYISTYLSTYSCLKEPWWYFLTPRHFLYTFQTLYGYPSHIQMHVLTTACMYVCRHASIACTYVCNHVYIVCMHVCRQAGRHAWLCICVYTFMYQCIIMIPSIGYCLNFTVNNAPYTIRNLSLINVNEILLDSIDNWAIDFRGTFSKCPHIKCKTGCFIKPLISGGISTKNCFIKQPVSNKYIPIYKDFEGSILQFYLKMNGFIKQPVSNDYVYTDLGGNLMKPY